MRKKLKIDQKTKKNKWNILNLSEEGADYDLFGSTHIEIYGNTRISIDGCLGVYEYRDTYLKLRMIKGALILVGSDFNIVYFENKVISIKGKVSAVEFV